MGVTFIFQMSIVRIPVMLYLRFSLIVSHTYAFMFSIYSTAKLFTMYREDDLSGKQL